MSKPSQKPELLRIGRIAERTGLSAKALRLYEARGLLKPTTHSASGYRLYGPEALERLMQIAVLKRAGFSLAEIGLLLSRDPQQGATVLATRIAALERDLTATSKALDSLRLAARRLGSASTLNVDELLESIAMTEKLKVDLTEKERAELLQRAEKLGEAGMQEAQQAWPKLIAEVRAAMEAGTPPTDPKVVELGKRWHGLVQAFTGHNPGINRKLSEAYLQQPKAMEAYGMSPEMFRYVGAAMAAAGLDLHR